MSLCENISDVSKYDGAKYGAWDKKANPLRPVFGVHTISNHIALFELNFDIDNFLAVQTMISARNL